MIRRGALTAALAAVLTSGLIVGAPAQAAGPLPFDVGGAFDLVDQHGQPRSHAAPDGRAQLLFFGYANCPSICSTAMPMMADAATLLADQGLPVSPVMITVDPERDHSAAMIEPMADLHPDFVGLTGSKTALAQAYKAFAIDSEPVFFDPEHGQIYSHGSFIYLLSADGDVLTLFPPILEAERVATIVQGYLDPKE